MSEVLDQGHVTVLDIAENCGQARLMQP